VEKHAGHTFQKGATLPHQETLIKWMQQKHNVPPPVPIPVVLVSHHTSLALWTDNAGLSPGSLSVW
jgi:hypothetical protein